MNQGVRGGKGIGFDAAAHDDAGAAYLLDGAGLRGANDLESFR